MTTTDARPLFVTRKVFIKRFARRLAASAFAMTVLNALSPYSREKRGSPSWNVYPAAKERTSRQRHEPAAALLALDGVIDEHRVSATHFAIRPMPVAAQALPTPVASLKAVQP